MKTKVYYSIVNCGDGSASPVFFLDEKIAELHQEAESYSDGWGEPCCGLAFTIISDSPVKIDGLGESAADLAKEFQERLDDEFYGEGPCKEVSAVIKKLKQIATKQ